MAARLGSAPHVVVLDDCEQVVAAAAEVVDQRLRRCPGLRVLATSGEALGVLGEAVVSVPPLSLPPSDEKTVPGATWTPKLCSSSAPEPPPPSGGWSPPPRPLPVMVEICHRLDGLALAIELAAGRLGVLSLEEIVAALDDHFTLLAAAGRQATARHRSLRHALDGSYDILSESERVLLGRMSVFRGGCTLDSAEEVSGGGSTPTTFSTSSTPWSPNRSSWPRRPGVRRATAFWRPSASTLASA